MLVTGIRNLEKTTLHFRQVKCPRALAESVDLDQHSVIQPHHRRGMLGRNRGDLLRARGSLRISLGRFNTATEVDRFLKMLPSIASILRPLTTRRAAHKNHAIYP